MISSNIAAAPAAGIFAIALSLLSFAIFCIAAAAP
jgi:hypothetical protein